MFPLAPRCLCSNRCRRFVWLNKIMDCASNNTFFLLKKHNPFWQLTMISPKSNRNMMMCHFFIFLIWQRCDKWVFGRAKIKRQIVFHRKLLRQLMDEFMEFLHIVSWWSPEKNRHRPNHIISEFIFIIRWNGMENVTFVVVFIEVFDASFSNWSHKHES